MLEYCDLLININPSSAFIMNFYNWHFYLFLVEFSTFSFCLASLEFGVLVLPCWLGWNIAQCCLEISNLLEIERYLANRTLWRAPEEEGSTNQKSSILPLNKSVETMKHWKLKIPWYFLEWVVDNPDVSPNIPSAPVKQFLTSNLLWELLLWL